MESAATVDADAAALWADLQEQRRTSLRTYVRALARKTQLREDVNTITDTMWAMIPALYLRLVRDAGWPPDRFETWLGDTFVQLWLPSTPAATPAFVAIQPGESTEERDQARDVGGGRPWSRSAAGVKTPNRLRRSA